MKEEKKKREAKRLASRLFSAGEGEVLGVIREIREHGDHTLIEALVRLYTTTPHAGVASAVLALLRDLKDQQSVDQLIMALEKVEDPDRKRELLTACWQSGLDFSRHTDTLLAIFLDADYATALEAFSVIEGSLPHLSDPSVLKKGLKTLKEQQVSADDPRYALQQALETLLDEHLRDLQDQT